MKEEKKLVGLFEGKREEIPPIWLMRQAGRYLPEYRELRAKAGSFWTLSQTPELAKEITLQPIRRFGFDAAILFSDILTIPKALGVDVWFEDGEGPRLKPITLAGELKRSESVWRDALAPAYEALAAVKAELDSKTTLIGFAGAPFTLATYLVAGRGGDEQKAAKLWAYRDPKSFGQILDILSASVAEHLSSQIDAGADVVQIFDSWAGSLGAAGFLEWSVKPAKKIVAQIRTKHPKARIIGFPRATTQSGYEIYARETGVDAVSIDTTAPIGWAAKNLSVIVQGNLDPVALVAGGDALTRAVDEILTAMKGRPFIFNLGHGILQETPIAHVERLIAQVRSFA